MSQVHFVRDSLKIGEVPDSITFALVLVMFLSEDKKEKAIERVRHEYEGRREIELFWYDFTELQRKYGLEDPTNNRS